jgi:hypothetical protein
MNAISFLTCKRFDLFQETVVALVRNCVDLDVVDAVFHYDDSSSRVERAAMRELIEGHLPGKLVLTQRMDPGDFRTGKHQMEMMSMWLSDMRRLGVYYVLHMEDDWRFDRPFSIREAIHIMNMDPTVAYVGYHQPYRPEIDPYREHHGMPPTSWFGNYWRWLYDMHRPVGESLFMDSVEIAYHFERFRVEGFWSNFINWPHYSFRPGVHDVARIATLGTFSTDSSSAELEFAERYARHFAAYMHRDRLCTHTGEERSAFKLNTTDR